MRFPTEWTQTTKQCTLWYLNIAMENPLCLYVSFRKSLIFIIHFPANHVRLPDSIVNVNSSLRFSPNPKVSDLDPLHFVHLACMRARRLCKESRNNSQWSAATNIPGDEELHEDHVVSARVRCRKSVMFDTFVGNVMIKHWIWWVFHVCKR